MNLTKHFTLEEMVHSQTASRLGIKNEPNQQQIDSMILLCQRILEPVRVYFDKFVIVDSGFRCKELNDAVPNSSKTSQHPLGEAADIVVSGTSVLDVFNFIKDNLEFDQVIYEIKWTHVSYKKGNNRKQILEATFINGKVHYNEWRKT
jgi:hypothetical protein